MSTNDKLVPGMVLGRYELLLPIAQGGMATVWAARQKGSRGFQKTVAIKTMLPSLSEDPQFEQMFLDEAALAARIHHPNVCETLDLGEQDEILYLVMEWVDGEALSIIHKAAKKNNAHVPLRIALRIVSQAAAGLHAAHELLDENDVPLELVHRDVSPQNILVTFDGIVKLVDFGVAKAVGRAGGETTAGQLKGKVPYMSPEQARGARVDRRTDIFALGIVLYKLTTGLHPFLGENDIVTMRNILSRPLLPPRVKNPSFPHDLDQILVKCLQKDPEKRFQTMTDFGAALDRAASAMSGAEEDVGGFVRTLLGEHGGKRRTALRDAARAMDERTTTGMLLPAVTLPARPMVHEGLSEIVLTQMNVGSKEEMLPERTSMETSPTNLLATSTSLPSSAPPSQIEMEARPRRLRLGGALGVTAAIAAISLGIFRYGAHRVTPVTSPPGSTRLAQANALARPGHDQARASGPDAAALLAAAVAASTTPATLPFADAGAAPSATAVPIAVNEPPTLTVEDLPSVEDSHRRVVPTPWRPPTPKPSSAPTVEAIAVPATPPPVTPQVADPVAKPLPKGATQWVPTVQNPGF